MADRFPLILNTSANQIQEIASGDQLDLSGVNIANTGIITAVAADIDDFVDVGSNIQLGNAGIITATTFSGSGASLTGIANANVASNAAIAGTKISPNFGAQNILTTGQLQISGALPTILLNDENNENDFELRNQNGSFIIRDIDNPQTRYTIASSGMIHTFHGAASFSSNLDVGAGLDVTGTITGTSHIDLPDGAQIKLGDSDEFIIQHTSGGASLISETGSGNLDISATNIQLKDASGNNKLQTNGGGIAVTGNATVSGNLSVGGVLTYEDVTNVDSVGIVTARLGVFIPDNNTLKFGNTSGSPDLKIEHVSSGTFNRLHATNGYMQYRASAHYINDEASSINFIRCVDKKVRLDYNGSTKLSTETGGVNITGICTATGGIFVPDNYQIQVGNAAGSADLRISHTSGTNIINSANGDLHFQHGNNNKAIITGGSLKSGLDGSIDLGTSSAKWQNVHAVRYYGDGSNLTGITQTTINGNAANRIITGSGTANTLTGNSDLLWNGSRLDIDTGGTEDALRIGNTAGTDTFIRLGSIGTSADTHAVIKYDKDDNYLSLLVSGESHGSGGVLVANGGNVSLSAGTSPASRLTIGYKSVSSYPNGNGSPSGASIDNVGGDAFIGRIFLQGNNKSANSDYLTGVNNEGSSLVLYDYSNNQYKQKWHKGLGSEIWYAGSKKFETTSTGVSLIGSDHNANGTIEVNDGSSGDCFRVLNGGALKWCLGTTGTTGNATVSMDARAYGTRARLHKWTSPNRDGGSYGNYSENWYDGGAYRTITSLSVGFAFDHHVVPGANDNYDLGNSSLRWRNVYTNDLNLSNEGGANEVDGTWGNYTIQEGESDLFLINKRNGKKYKFNLTEVV